VGIERAMRFRPLQDPLLIVCLAVYALNRFVLKPYLPWSFLHEHLNDLICLPFWVPIMLFVQKSIGLRPDDQPPRASEIAIPLVLWSWVFEIWLPYTPFGRQWCTADPADIVSYSLGALGAAAFWNWWYGRRQRVSLQTPSIARSP